MLGLGRRVWAVGFWLLRTPGFRVQDGFRKCVESSGLGFAIRGPRRCQPFQPCICRSDSLRFGFRVLGFHS